MNEGKITEGGEDSRVQSGSFPLQKLVMCAVGDYVLATKYSDGDPCDHFYVGFVSGHTHNKRYLIADSEGNNQRANGFRRAERITAEEGRQLVEMMPDIGDQCGPSIWHHLAKIRGLAT